MEKKLVQSFRIILSIVFIFSAIAKLVSLTFFDGMVAELLLGEEYYNHPDSLYYVQLLTRFLISLELILGASLLQTKNLKLIVLPLLQLMLIVFTAHLFYVSLEYMSEGKTFREAFLDGNCGCFGDIMPMSNFESILKNIVSMFLVGYLWLKINNHKRKDIRINTMTLPIILGLVTFGSLLLTVKSYNNDTEIKEVIYHEEVEITPIKSDSIRIDSSSKPTKSVQEQIEIDAQVTGKKKSKEPFFTKTKPKKIKEQKTPKVVEIKLSYSELLAKYTNYSNDVKANLNQGEKLICMFSLSCGHCQETYKAICEMSDSGKLPNTLLLVYGNDFELNLFFNQAGCKHPYIMIDDYNDFKMLLKGHDFPYILARNNGINSKTWDLDDKEIGKGIAKHYGIEKTKPKPSSIFGEEEEETPSFGG